MFKDFSESKTVRGIGMGLGIAILVLLIFKAGEVTGDHKARFSEGVGNNFRTLLADPRESNTFFFGQGGVPGGHGAAGKIISLALPKMVIAGPDNLEKTVVVSDTTLIRKYQEQGTQKDLTADAFVVVLGEPNAQGEIIAKLIRILPPVPESIPTSTHSN